MGWKPPYIGKNFFILKEEPITIKRQSGTDSTSYWRFKQSKANPYDMMATGHDILGNSL